MKSKEEELFSKQIKILFAAEPALAGLTFLSATYEAIKFQLPGGLYTPDFYIKAELPDGTRALIQVEIKGSKSQKGYRSSRQKLRAAASLYPEFIWLTVVMDRGLGRIAEIEVMNVKEFLRISK